MKKNEENDLPWGTSQAWWGILSLLGLAILFNIIVSALVGSGIIRLPAPVTVGIITTLLYGTIFIVVYYLTKAHIDKLAFSKFSFLPALGYAILFFIAIFVFEILWASFLKLVGVQPPDSASPIVEIFGTSALGLVIVFIVTVVIAPVVEEIFFRSFLYQAFRKRYGVILGILISALIFALFHFGFLTGLPVFLAIGILLGYIFERYQSVYPAIMLHSINNLFFFIILLVSV